MLIHNILIKLNIDSNYKMIFKRFGKMYGLELKDSRNLKNINLLLIDFLHLKWLILDNLIKIILKILLKMFKNLGKDLLMFTMKVISSKNKINNIMFQLLIYPYFYKIYGNIYLKIKN